MEIKKPILKYQYVLVIGLSILFLAFLLIYLADIKNIFDIREVYSHHYIPLLWPSVFGEGMPIEIFHLQFIKNKK